MALRPTTHYLPPLGECTAMTIRWYALREKWPLDKVEITLTHHKEGRTDNFSKKITLHGDPISKLLCLQLSDCKVVDSSIGFFGNLPSRNVTIQRCHNRANGMLADYVLGKPLKRSVYSLNHHDVEILVTNYIMQQNLCVCVLHGSKANAGIDHAGITKQNKEFRAQTTISSDAETISKKIDSLSEFAKSNTNRELYFFAPKKTKPDNLGLINYIPIEDVFSVLDSTPSGSWLINMMLPQ